tara:strand:+ start:139 stop:516 length:378 start_codon:yes stop_codon:yes gene_type:complete
VLAVHHLHKKKKVRNNMKKETIEFLRETRKHLKELEETKESMLDLEADIENTYDIEDENEQIDEHARLEIEHGQKSDYAEYLVKQISEDFTIDVAKDLLNYIDVDTIDYQQSANELFANQKVSVQ